METLENNEPPVDQPLMVSFDNNESLGYLDKQGVWHEWFSDKELTNVTDWSHLGGGLNL